MKYIRENDNYASRKKSFKFKIRINPFTSLSIPYIGLLFIFILLPMLIIILYALTEQKGDILQFTLQNFRNIFSQKEYLKTYIDSIWLAIITTIFCLLIGYPTAYFIAKMRLKNANLFILLISAPMWVNMLLRTFAWKNILDDSGPINNFLKLFGIKPIHFLGTDFAIILGMVYIFLPFMVLPIHTVLQKMDKAYIEASNDLGANPFYTFFKVTLPLSVSGILSGIIMVLLPAATTLVIPKYLGEGRYNIGNLIEKYFYNDGQWSFGSAISILLAIIIMFLIWGIRKFDHQVEE